MTEPLHVQRDRLLAEIAAKHGVTINDITGPSRVQYICKARFEWWYECRRRFPSMSLPAIGRRTGGRDHSTVIHGAREHAKRNGLPYPPIPDPPEPPPEPKYRPDWWND